MGGTHIEPRGALDGYLHQNFANIEAVQRPRLFEIVHLKCWQSTRVGIIQNVRSRREYGRLGGTREVDIKTWCAGQNMMRELTEID